MTKKWVSDESYVANQGLVCPWCEGEDQTYMFVECMQYVNPQIEVEVTCNTCDAHWMEIYKLAGWKEMED